MNTSDMIRRAVSDMPQGAVFSSADFLMAGTRAAVDQTLYRMMKAGLIVRVTRGLYGSAGGRVDAEAIAAAVAKRTGEKLGLAPSAGQHGVLEVPTSGPSRSITAAEHVVRFRRMSQRKVQLASTPKGRVLLELWACGQKNLTTVEIKRATGDWLAGELDDYAAMIPAWLRTAIQRTNSPRKSEKIGLSGAYDWSNPHIKDDVLIGKVLEKYKFEDVARLCFYYGLPKVRRVFKQRHFEPMTHASVTRMLKNISKGLRALGKVSFHSRNETEIPRQQIDFLKSSRKIAVSDKGFNVLAVDGLFVMKSILTYDRVKSRDLYDLMILTRDHGYSISDIFAAIEAYQPIRNKDPEHFKNVATGLVPLDKDDEGFSSIQLNVKMGDIYEYLKS